MAIVPVFPSLDEYCNEVQNKFCVAGFQVECDLDVGTTLNKKIRSNQLAQFNFIGGTQTNLFFLSVFKSMQMFCSNWSTRAKEWND